MYFCSFVCVMLPLCLGYHLQFVLWIYLLAETFVTGLVLVPLYSIVLDSNSNSTFTALTSFRWLMLSPCEDSNMFVLICAKFAYVTALCSLIERTEILVYTISYCLFALLFSFWVYCWGATLFSVCCCLGFFTLSSFRIKSSKDFPL
jgi:hypothetical protein